MQQPPTLLRPLPYGLFRLLLGAVVIATLALPELGYAMPLNRAAITLKVGHKFFALQGGGSPIALPKRTPMALPLKNKQIIAHNDTQSTELAALALRKAADQALGGQFASARATPLEEETVRTPFQTLEQRRAARQQATTPFSMAGGTIWPIAETARQYISSPFGERVHPVTHQLSQHEGIDIAAATGTPALAVANATVLSAGRDGNLGNCVRLRLADDSEATYGHLSQINVHAGQQLQQGETVGEVGSTGRSTGSHLHFAIARGGEYVNPLASLPAPPTTKLADASR